MLNVQQVSSRVDRLSAKYAARDMRMNAVRAVRAGNMAHVYPELFGQDSSYPMVSNFIDVVARDISEVIAPLPALNCASGTMTTDVAKKRAAKRGRIGAHYWLCSNLRLSMFSAGDHWLTYGFSVGIVEPNYDESMPRIRFIDPVGCYPDFDSLGNCVSLAEKWTVKASTLAAQYPEYRRQILGTNVYGNADKDLVVYRWTDKDQTLVVVPERDNLVIEAFANKLGECPVEVAVRPSPDSEMRGQFDDVLGVQAARAIMARLAVEAANKAVQAPISVPDDVQELSIGPDAVIRSSQPANVRRVDLSVGQSTFAEGQMLENELRVGTRYPQGRQGAVQGSIVTGKGVEALLGGFETQVKTAQLVFAEMLRKLTRKAFKMDELYWPGKSKTIRGSVEGTPFEVTYIPAKDINGDYTCDVTYGFMAGLDPNRALVWGLQALGAGLLDKGTLMRNLPIDVNVIELQQNIDTEKVRDAALQGVYGYAQAIGPLVQQGGDPQQVLQQIAKIVKGIQSGTPIEDALLNAFKPSPEELAEQQQQQQQDPMAQLMGGGGPGGPGGGPDGGGGPPGQVLPNGLLRGQAPGQQGMPPGGRPSIQNLVAALGAGGSPNLSAGVRRQIPTG